MAIKVCALILLSFLSSAGRNSRSLRLLRQFNYAQHRKQQKAAENYFLEKIFV